MHKRGWFGNPFSTRSLPNKCQYSAADDESADEGWYSKDWLNVQPRPSKGEGGQCHQAGHHCPTFEHAHPPEWGASAKLRWKQMNHKRPPELAWHILWFCGLTMCLGEWRHSPSARAQRLRSPSGRWQEDPEWKRENSNKSGNTFAPEESHSGPSCLHVVSCRKPPLTSPDFQQRVSQIMFSFYGWEKRRIFGLKAISH